MRILVLSFYYPPDLCAGSFRTGALMEALVEGLPAHAGVDVISTLPNRYSTFSAEAPAHESTGPVEIFRVKLPAHQSGMLDQSRAFILFARKVNQLVAGREYDLVYATSSRLMTAVLGAWVAKRKGARLYLDIRDIFLDTIKDVLATEISFLVQPIFSWLERWTIHRAEHVNLVSRGFLPYFESRYPDRTFSCYTNGIDREFISAAESVTPSSEAVAVPIKVLYAGNIGEGQGLHAVLPELARRMAGRAHFVVVGDGGRKSQLREALDKARVTNVDLRLPLERTELIKAYQAADVLFLHLNNYDAFLNVLPSKLFEYGALGKPIWAGVAGHSAGFIRDELDNAAVFHPCDVEQAVKAFETLKIVTKPRKEFVARYGRVNIMREMATSILGLVAGVAK